MSDSDTDLLSNDVLTFQSQGTTLSARGPNINNTNISSFSFRNNVMTSTMNMPWNMNRHRYAESICDQRSICHGRERESSPMSFHSASGIQSQRLHHSYYPGGSHRSVYNGRSGSPTSIRTLDSNRSMSAKDIAFGFQNGIYNKFDFKIIKDAYNKFIKHSTWKRVEKRRNIRKFLKGFRRRSGGDSGDQASNSSISSDDCASIRTARSTFYKTNMSSCRSTKTDISDFRKTMKESNIFRDCTENMRQKSFKSMLPQGPSREKESLLSLHQKWQDESMAFKRVNNHSMPIREVNAQKDRFKKNSFPLPSQRFNQSVCSLTSSEKPNRLQTINEQNYVVNQIERSDRQSQETESEQEEIFADVTVTERNCINNSSKRNREEDNINEKNKKRTKVSPSPIKSKTKTAKQNNQINIDTKQISSDFVFAKPQVPVRKQTISKLKLTSHKHTKQEKQLNTENNKLKSLEQSAEKVISGSQKTVEKLISKSIQPLDPTSTEKNSERSIRYQEKEILSTDTTHHSTTDMSMRPSFIKRKLFTHKVDNAEKNSSSGSLQEDSPQTDIYSKIQKEKNRARKLVATQSCLNRDVSDDSNLLDLIHKIVPADRMNITTVTNKTEMQNNKSKPTNPDKWDITSMITTGNNSDDISDTYTDEDIFTEDGEKQQQNNKTKTQKSDEKKKNTPIIEKAKKAKRNVINKPKKKPINEAKQNSAVIFSEQQIQETSQLTECQVIIQKLQANNNKEPINTLTHSSPTEKNDLVKVNIHKGVKSFWDTDSESDVEATPLKGIDPKNTDASYPEIMTKALPQKYNAPLNKVSKQPNASDLFYNKINEITEVKTMANRPITSTLKDKQDGKTNKESKKSITNHQTFDKISAKNKVVEKAVKSTKSNKTLPTSLKENKPPNKESIKNTNNKLSNTLKKVNKNGKGTPDKKMVGRIQKMDNKALEKIKTQINNKDLALENKESQHIKVHNNTLTIRAHRKPKVHKCCGEPDTSDLSESNNNNTTLYRSLRSRLVDISGSLKSDDSNSKLRIKTAAKSKKPKVSTDDVCKSGGEKTLTSDVSFTLTTELMPLSNRTMRNRKASATSEKRQLRQSDVSFSLSENKLPSNTSLSTNRFKRNREIELLQNKTRKRSPINRTMALKSRAINRSNNTWLNKSRQLI